MCTSFAMISSAWDTSPVAQICDALHHSINPSTYAGLSQSLKLNNSYNTLGNPCGDPQTHRSG